MSEQIRVLIVDDEPSVQFTLRLASRKRRWQITSVESAEEALTKLPYNSFDVALVDKNLPGMTGVELIREIRRTNLIMGIVMITGFASVNSAIETLHLGIDSYIEKPFDDIYDVVERVEEVAADRRSEQNGGDAAAASMHFLKAVDALQAQKKLSRELKVIVASPTLSDREWMVAQLGDATKVVTVASSEEALLRAREEAPEMLIIDISVQNPGVLDTLREIKASAPRAAFIVLTAKEPPLSTIAPLIELGVRVILEKPLDKEAFCKKLEFVAREVGQI